MDKPKLSICVPSRNRQTYLADLVGWLARSPRADVQFVIADNSDDPSVMNDVMAAHRGDARFRYLPTGPAILPMIGNWDRTISAATGDWVTVIGDDDVADPELAETIRLCEALKPDVEAISWSGVSWDWPRPGKSAANVATNLGASLHDMPHAMLMARAFGWAEATAKVTCGFSIYHSAISARLIARIRKAFGGAFFTHPTVDYDSAFKIIALGRSFILSIRPFSIFGACPESNTTAASNMARLREAHAVFLAETGRNIDADPWMEGFPFPSLLGLTATIAQVQRHFLHLTRLADVPGWEARFAEACAKNCEIFTDPEEFALAEAGYREAFSRWQGGRWLASFAPERKERHAGLPFTGVHENQLFLGDGTGGAKTATGFYDVLSDILVRPAELPRELRSAGRENLVLATA